MATTRKTVIVTGGSQGIGAGIVKAFLARGYNVVATARRGGSALRQRQVRLAERPSHSRRSAHLLSLVC